MTTDKGERPDDFYEVLPNIVNELGDEILSASFTSNNGIRIQIFNTDEINWNVFDFEPDQAEMIGLALIRWAQRDRADRPASNAGGEELTPVAWQYLLPDGRWSNMPGDWTPDEGALAQYTYRPLYAGPRVEAEKLRKALEMIRQTPSMPFPDPIAHSWAAYAMALMRAWSDIQNIARDALVPTHKNDAAPS